MPGVDSDLTTQYGDYQFSVMCETQGIQGTPVYDAAGRTIAYWVWSITIRDIIQNPDGVDDAVHAALDELTRPAKPFRYFDNGFKPLRVNVGGQKDVVWGPKPQLLSVKPKGGGNAVEIVWNVQVALPEFGVNPPFGRPLMFNYSLSTSVSRAGISRRTYTASLQIPLTRTNPNSREITDHADRFLEEINPPLVPGFRRGDRQRTLDEAKTKLTYTLVDEELPSSNVPPPGCVDATAEHSIETDSFANLSWTGNITASYELVKGLTKSVALSYFGLLVHDRLSEARKHADALQVIPTRFSVREGNLYGAPSVSFALSYRYTTTLQNLFQAHGLFRPVPGSDWRRWATSLEKSAFAPRGIAGLKFEGAHDAIVDLGSPQEKLPLPVVAAAPAGKLPGKLQDLFGLPAPEKSWVLYENSLQITHADETSVLKKLPQAAINGAGAVVQPFAEAVKGYVAPYVGPQGGTVVQRRAEPTYIVIMTGKALRAGYQIPAPHLVTVGGATAVPQNEPGYGFRSGVAGNWGGVPLIGAHWRLKYVLTGRPDQVSVQPNPIVANGKAK
jgi:hypothetical protein